MTTTPFTLSHTLVLEAEDLSNLYLYFGIDFPLESAAFLLARPVQTPQNRWRLLVYDVVFLEPDQYAYRTPVDCEVFPTVVADVVSRARREQASIILTHSHPGNLDVRPSTFDLSGEAQLRPTLHRRVPASPHGRLILGDGAAHAALFLPDGSEHEQPMKVIGVGEDIWTYPVIDTPLDERLDKRYSRQIGAFGYQRLSQLRVGIVGLGGTGSVVAQQLAHLGVGSFHLIDPGVIERSNLNHVVGATLAHADAASKKVDVAAAMIRQINPLADVTTLVADIRDGAVARTLLDCQFFFTCTDSHGSRAVLSQLAHQYRLPGIDLGVAVYTQEREVTRMHLSEVTHVAGRVQMLAPGLACLSCSAVLDPEEVRCDLLTDGARQANPHTVRGAFPQPAVISVNSAAASLAVTMMLSAITGMPFAGRHLRLRLEAGQVESVDVRPDPHCPVCSSLGASNRGDQWAAPGRKEPAS